jgi:hypothetical protein
VADMHEFGAVEHFLVFSAFDVGAHEPAHPVVGDADGGEDLELAECLEGN